LVFSFFPLGGLVQDFGILESRSDLQILVEIAATLMTRYRDDELKSGDVSQMIGLLGKIGFSPNKRGKRNLQRLPIADESSC
jgi:hypothetical protein